MHIVSLLLHGFNFSRDRLVKDKLFTYTFKHCMIIFQREIIKSKGEVILVAIINMSEVIDIVIQLLSPVKFCSGQKK